MRTSNSCSPSGSTTGKRSRSCRWLNAVTPPPTCHTQHSSTWSSGSQPQQQRCGSYEPAPQSAGACLSAPIMQTRGTHAISGDENTLHEHNRDEMRHGTRTGSIALDIVITSRRVAARRLARPVGIAHECIVIAIAVVTTPAERHAKCGRHVDQNASVSTVCVVLSPGLQRLASAVTHWGRPSRLSKHVVPTTRSPIAAPKQPVNRRPWT